MDHFIFVHLCMESQMGWCPHQLAMQQEASSRLRIHPCWSRLGDYMQGLLRTHHREDRGTLLLARNQNSSVGGHIVLPSHLEVTGHGDFFPALQIWFEDSTGPSFHGSEQASLPKHHCHSNLMMSMAVLHRMLSESLGLSWWGRWNGAARSMAMESCGGGCSHPRRSGS